jgi:glutamyl-tRNA synthetase
MGSVRTALFNWLAARAARGSFVLRIEDTDQQRYVEGSEAQITASLRWLGLDWDEGPEVGGPHAPYIQSMRTDRYLAAGRALAEGGRAYWCTCTPERLEAMRRQQQAAKQPTRYDRRCLTRQDEVAAERAAGAPAVLRLRMPEGTAVWEDLIRGHMEIENANVDDQVLLKSDGYPTYHLANVVDDHDMQISHVIRAEEWIPSTPKHLAIYAAMGWEPPVFAHVPVVLGPDRQKLSKRRGAPSILEYRDMGYLPEAVVNAMALLGWSSGTEEEVFTPEELCARFSLDRVHPSPAIHDPARLDALNGLHIRRLPPEELAVRLQPWLSGLDLGTIRSLVPVLQERITRLDAAAALVAPLLTDPGWPESGEWPPKKVDAATAAALLDAAIEAVDAGGLDDLEALRGGLTAVVDARGVKARDAFRVLYMCILGAPAGLPVFDAMRFLGRERTLERLRRGRATLAA